MDIAILHTSKAVNAEAREVFYSTNTFDFQVPPSSSQSVKPFRFLLLWPFHSVRFDKEMNEWKFKRLSREALDLIEDRDYRKSKDSPSQEALNLIEEVKDPKEWIITPPSQKAFDLIRDIKISYSVFGFTGAEGYDYSKGSLSEEIVKKLQSTKVLRNSLIVNLYPVQLTKPTFPC